MVCNICLMVKKSSSKCAQWWVVLGGGGTSTTKRRNATDTVDGKSNRRSKKHMNSYTKCIEVARNLGIRIGNCVAMLKTVGNYSF